MHMNILETLGSSKIWWYIEVWNLYVWQLGLKFLYSKRFDRWQSNSGKPGGARTQEMCVVHPSFSLLLFPHVFISASHKGYLIWELRAGLMLWLTISTSSTWHIPSVIPALLLFPSLSWQLSPSQLLCSMCTSGMGFALRYHYYLPDKKIVHQNV